MKSDTELTDNEYWDNYWTDYKLPAIVEMKSGNQVINAQLRTLDLFLIKDSKKNILEIGGAPGQYLAYFAKKYGFKASALDYSSTGCEVTRKNFELLGLDVNVYQQDLISMDGTLPLFDIVYSMGVIEHFTDLEIVIGKHLDLLKPGGLLIIGVPYFIKTFSPLLKVLAPKTMSGHCLDSIDMRNWSTFERKYNLDILFKNYIGGFEPLLIKAVINQELEYADTSGTSIKKYLVSMLDFYAKVRSFVHSRIISYSCLEHLNSRISSAYALSIYRKPF